MANYCRIIAQLLRLPGIIARLLPHSATFLLSNLFLGMEQGLVDRLVVAPLKKLTASSEKIPTETFATLRFDINAPGFIRGDPDDIHRVLQGKILSKYIPSCCVVRGVYNILWCVVSIIYVPNVYRPGCLGERWLLYNG